MDALFLLMPQLFPGLPTKMTAPSHRRRQSDAALEAQADRKRTVPRPGPLNGQSQLLANQLLDAISLVHVSSRSTPSD
jgi:hypothetical protein